MYETLRHYQKTAIDETRKLYQRGIRRVLLHLATGGGKTHIFCTMMQLAHEKGSRSLVVVHGVKLIDQASQRLTREGIPHGIIQGTNTRDNHHPIQICSIDTCYRRKQAPEADFVVIDEAHLTRGAAFAWFLSNYEKAKILAVTATPHLKKGMRHVADEVVYPITVDALIKEGYLVPSKCYAPTTPDLSGVRKTGDDYNEKDLSDVMSHHAIIGDPLKYYKQIGENRPALMFAVTVNHSKLLVEAFNAGGVPADHIDANTPMNERNKKIADLESGKIKVLSSVGVLTTGFDCPVVGCLIVCRPTMSYNMHIQILGRGTRPFPGKDNFIVLDHSGNIRKHGFFEDEKTCNLDGRKHREAGKEAATVDCQGCMAIYSAGCKVCPNCGAENEKYKDKHRNVSIDYEGKLDLIERDVSRNAKNKRAREIQNTIFNIVAEAKHKGYKKGWVYHQIIEKLGKDVADKEWFSIRRMNWETREQKIQSSLDLLKNLDWATED